MSPFARLVPAVALTLLGVGVSSIAATANTWSQFGGSAAHLSYSNDPKITASGAPTTGVRWMANLFSADLGSPVVAWNAKFKKFVAYVANERADVFALDAQTGQFLWSVNLGLGDAIRATPAVAADGSVWVSTHYNPAVYKLDGATGAVQCSNKAVLPIDGSPIFASPATGVPAVYFVSVDSSHASGPLVALRESDCSRIYTFTKYQGVAGSWVAPAYGSTSLQRPLVLVGTADPDDTEYAIDAATGALLWQFPLSPPPGDNDIGSAATISAPKVNGFADGAVYANDKYGIEFAIDLTTGAKIWSTDLFASGGHRVLRSSAALDGNTLVVGRDGGVDALDATTGAIRWHHGNALEVVSSPAIAGPAGDETVAYGGIDGAVRLLSLANGNLLYTYQTGGFITSSPAISNGDVLIASSDGFLYAFAAGGANGAPPVTSITSPANSSTVPNPNGSLSISGTAADSTGVRAVEIALQSNGSSGSWYDVATGTYTSAPVRNLAVLGSPGAPSTDWSFQLPVPAAGGNFEVFANSVNAGSVVDRGATSSFAVAPSSSEPRLNVFSRYIPPSSTFRAQAHGFGAGETVDFSLFGTVVATATASPSGNLLSVPVTAPANALFGPTSLSAVGRTSGKASTAAIDVTNEWTQFGYGASHDAYEPNDPVILNSVGIGKDTVLKRAWYYATGSPVNSSPVVVNGTAYVGDESGTVTAIVTNTGAPKWTYVTPSHAAIRSAPAVDSLGNVIVASSDGNLYELDPGGKLLRTIPLGGHLTSPALDDDTIVVASDNGNAYEVAASTGAIVWMTKLSGPAHSAPAFDAAAGIIVTGDDSGAVTALGATNGAQLWKVATGGPVTAPPVLFKGIVIAGSHDGNVYALGERKGVLKWKFQTDAPVEAAAAVFSDGAISVGSKKGTLYLLRDGKAIYTQPPSSHGNSAIVGVAAVEGNVLAETAKGLVSITRQSGGAASTPWFYQTRSTLATSPAIIDGAVYVSAADGGVYAFTPEGHNPVPSALREGPRITITDAWTCTTP